MGDSQIVLSPARGGGILSFSWRNIEIFRPYTTGDKPIDLASFPLVPFCNRIANRRLRINGEDRLLPAPPKGIETPHAIHGLGWTSAWAVKELSAEAAKLALLHDGMQWPWSFAAEQTISLTDSGYVHRLALTNTDDTPMPIGLGLHPYFPRAGAKLKVGANGFWENGPDQLPTRHVTTEGEPDWFGGEAFDNLFTGSRNPIEIDWPRHRLRIHTSANLPFTHVYTPPGADFFCVEPVSHIPDAVNSPHSGAATGRRMLASGECMAIECRFEVEATD